MKRFTELFLELDRTNKTNEKVERLKSYFLTAPDADKIWALALFSGRRPARKVSTAQVREWAIERAGIPAWLFSECHQSVGDLGETISLILPVSHSTAERSLSEWFHYFQQLDRASDEMKKELILSAWKQLSPYETFVFNKLMMGSFRIGVSQTLVLRAIAEISGLEPAVVSHRIMGNWDPFTVSFHDLIYAENRRDELSRPYPFYLAYAIESALDTLGDPGQWNAEWKWDGIRSQIISRGGELFVWSRGEELITAKFPELESLRQFLPDGSVLDGELLCFDKGRPMPFNILQTRIGRKQITKKTLADAPVAFLAYDLLEHEGKDIRALPMQLRRNLLESVYSANGSPGVFRLSPLVLFNSWEELRNLHTRSREMNTEGFMLKRKDSPYLSGRKKGDWWKWKVDPLSIDAVLVYAQKGHGRRAELYSDYTFAVWDEDKLITFAKAYSGLSDAELREVDRFVKQHTVEKFGPVRTVRPELVFEIGFEGINASGRHKSGIAVRFPRILRWRKDKVATEADSLGNLKKILELYR